MMIGKGRWRLGAALAVILLAPGLIRAQAVIPLQEFTPDRACGPRCLLALIKTTGVGRQDSTLKSIYGIIGKKPLAVTSLKDLWYAARQLGFRAQGYRLRLDVLRRKEGYAIVPLALTTREQKPFLHFVLVKQIGPDYVTIVDVRTMETRAIPSAEFEKVWNGYALVISSADSRTPLPKPPDDIVAPERETSAGSYDATWDFGVAESGALLEHTFLLGPAGSGSDGAQILGKSCSCVEARLGRDTAGNACVTIKLRVKQAAWQQADVKLKLPGGAVKQYQVKAFGQAMFVVRPERGYVEIPHAGASTYPVEVSYYADANDFIEFRHMRSDIPNVRLGPVTRRSEALKNGAVSHTFTLPLVCSLAAEPNKVVLTRKTIDFLFDTAQGQKQVPLEMTIKTGAERVKVFPQRLFLLVSASEESPCRHVRLEFVDQTPPDEVAGRVIGDLPLAVVSSLAGNTCTAQVRVDRRALKNLPAGSRKGVIRFTPRAQGRPRPAIEVPVTMLLRR
jgi:predicted double-glycine peptidase